MASEGPEEEEEDEEEAEERQEERHEPDELIRLLEELRRVLADVLRDENRAVSEFVPAYLYPRFRDAWDDVSRRFDEVIAEIRSGAHEPGLERHGLRGASSSRRSSGRLTTRRTARAS